MKPFYILLIEDTPEWEEDINQTLHTVARKRGISIRIENASTGEEAQSKTDKHCFHGISSDQNMPSVKGGPISAKVGMNFLGALGGGIPPAYIAMYTAYPRADAANMAGHKGITDYIVKSSKTETDDKGNRKMITVDYVEFFVGKFIGAYVERSLELAAKSGFKSIRDQARITRKEFERFASSGEKDPRAVNEFMHAFGKLTEIFNRHFEAFLTGIAGANSVLLAKHTAKTVEDSIRKTFDSLVRTDGLEPVRAYFHLLEGNLSLGGRYTDASGALRALRNQVVHGAKSYSTTDYQDNQRHMVMVLDFLVWFSRRPMLVSPFRSREYFMRSTNIRSEYAEYGEQYFEQNIPDSNAEDVFTQLFEDDDLRRIKTGIQARISNDTGDPQLQFEFGS